jgi:hypothetical protein
LVRCAVRVGHIDVRVALGVNGKHGRIRNEQWYAPKAYLRRFFDNFTSRLEQEGSVDAGVVARLRASLGKKQYSAEKLRTAMFSDEKL